MTLGEMIKERREAAGITQEELAEKLCVSRQAVSKWESDLSVPNADNMCEIRNILGMEETTPEPGAEAPKMKKFPVFALGWIIAAILAAMLCVSLILPAAPAKNEITGVTFYDAGGNIVDMKDNWYTLGAETTIVVTFGGETPETVTAYITPTGTETASARKQMTVVPLSDVQSYALVHLSLSDATMGHLQISLDYGGNSIVSDYYNIYYEPAN